LKILVVDDEHVALTSIQRLLKRRGIRDVQICGDGAEAVDRIKNEAFDIVLLDVLMPEMDGLQVLEATRPFRPDVEFVILTAVDDVDTAVKALRLGAFDYIVKPVDNARLFLSIERAYERRGLRAGLAGSRGQVKKESGDAAFGDLLTQNPRMFELLAFARVMARAGNPILITGESGTGKELIARGIHRASPMADGPFVAVNVSAIPESLFESQVFGHLKGAFTGAERDHAGFFEQADGGTLFMDEIGELPLGLQAKLLRVIEEKRLVRLGATQPMAVNVRIVSATNIDMDKAVKEGGFRLDLACRLRSAHIHLPPLRERREDIPLLAGHFLEQACRRHAKGVRGLSPAALDLLVQKEFAGNVRALAQAVENGVLLAEGEWVEPQHLDPSHQGAVDPFARTLCPLKADRNTHVAFVLAHTRGDRRQAADILGVSIRQVQRLITQLQADPRWQPLMADLPEGGQ
jgi:DNA-binding NtrC family response regulator